MNEEAKKVETFEVETPAPAPERKVSKAQVAVNRRKEKRAKKARKTSKNSRRINRGK